MISLQYRICCLINVLAIICNSHFISSEFKSINNNIDSSVVHSTIKRNMFQKPKQVFDFSTEKDILDGKQHKSYKKPIYLNHEILSGVNGYPLTSVSNNKWNQNYITNMKNYEDIQNYRYFKLPKREVYNVRSTLKTMPIKNRYNYDMNRLNNFKQNDFYQNNIAYTPIHNHQKTTYNPADSSFYPTPQTSNSELHKNYIYKNHNNPYVRKDTVRRSVENNIDHSIFERNKDDVSLENVNRFQTNFPKHYKKQDNLLHRLKKSLMDKQRTNGNVVHTSTVNHHPINNSHWRQRNYESVTIPKKISGQSKIFNQELTSHNLIKFTSNNSSNITNFIPNTNLVSSDKDVLLGKRSVNTFLNPNTRNNHVPIGNYIINSIVEKVHQPQEKIYNNNRKLGKSLIYDNSVIIEEGDLQNEYDISSAKSDSRQIHAYQSQEKIYNGHDQNFGKSLIDNNFVIIDEGGLQLGHSIPPEKSEIEQTYDHQPQDKIDNGDDQQLEKSFIRDNSVIIDEESLQHAYDNLSEKSKIDEIYAHQPQENIYNRDQKLLESPFYKTSIIDDEDLQLIYDTLPPKAEYEQMYIHQPEEKIYNRDEKLEEALTYDKSKIIDEEDLQQEYGIIPEKSEVHQIYAYQPDRKRYNGDQKLLESPIYDKTKGIYEDGFQHRIPSEKYDIKQLYPNPPKKNIYNLNRKLGESLIYNNPIIIGKGGLHHRYRIPSVKSAVDQMYNHQLQENIYNRDQKLGESLIYDEPKTIDEGGLQHEYGIPSENFEIEQIYANPPQEKVYNRDQKLGESLIYDKTRIIGEGDLQRIYELTPEKNELSQIYYKHQPQRKIYNGGLKLGESPIYDETKIFDEGGLQNGYGTPPEKSEVEQIYLGELAERDEKVFAGNVTYHNGIERITPVPGESIHKIRTENREPILKETLMSHDVGSKLFNFKVDGNLEESFSIDELLNNPSELREREKYPFEQLPVEINLPSKTNEPPYITELNASEDKYVQKSTTIPIKKQRIAKSYRILHPGKQGSVQFINPTLPSRPSLRIITLGSGGKYKLPEGIRLQPGEEIPGTLGLKVPEGFRAHVIFGNKVADSIKNSKFPSNIYERE